MIIKYLDKHLILCLTIKVLFNANIGNVNINDIFICSNN